MNIFDIIGPVMIGPSSSHTAGALRIGRAGYLLLGEEPASADIGLSGSFAETGKGHGTDKALIAGLLGMLPDDERIRNSFDIAREQGLSYTIHNIRLPRAHPNTARLRLKSRSGRECALQGASVGGGNIVITSVNGTETAVTGQNDTLIISHKDMPGIIAEVATVLSWYSINIGNFRLNRPDKGYQAVMVIEIDGKMQTDVLDKLRSLPHISGVIFLRALNHD
jgi:L-serine dehydratase